YAACSRSAASGTWWRWRSCPRSARWTSSPIASAPCRAWSGPRRRWCCRPNSNVENPLKKSDFHYRLPPELIAQAPLPERSASRLLLVPRAPAPFADHGIRDLPTLLQPGDLLVFNDTRVIPARLFGRKQGSSGRAEILVERLLPGNQARVQLGVSKPMKPGGRIELDAGGQAEVLGREGEFYLLRFEVEGDLAGWLRHAGQLPLPPYIHRAPEADDQERYQTVFAREPGAVAAPTAGLHFDEQLLQALRERG